MSKLTNAEKDKLDNTCGNLRVTKLGTHVKTLEDFVNEGVLDTRANTVVEAINELYGMIVNKDCEGITIPPPGFFTLFGNDEDGKLYCYYNDQDHPPLFEHIETPGELEGTLYLYIADPEGDNHFRMEIGHYIAVRHLDNYYTKSQCDAKYPVTVQKQTNADSGYAATYVVKQNNAQVGTKINIPKDFFLKGGSVKTCTTANNPVQGYAVGDKYLDMEINVDDGGATTKHMYILVKDLVDAYTADGTTLSLSNSNVFSVKDEGISSAKLASNAVTSAKIASNAVTSAKIASNAVTDEKINSVNASKVSGLSTVATSGSYNDLSNKPNIPPGVTVVDTVQNGNANAVSSNAVYDYIASTIPVTLVDAVANGNMNAVTSNAVYDYIANIVDTIIAAKQDEVKTQAKVTQFTNKDRVNIGRLLNYMENGSGSNYYTLNFKMGVGTSNSALIYCTHTSDNNNRLATDNRVIYEATDWNVHFAAMIYKNGTAQPDNTTTITFKSIDGTVIGTSTTKANPSSGCFANHTFLTKGYLDVFPRGGGIFYFYAEATINGSVIRSNILTVFVKDTNNKVNHNVWSCGEYHNSLSTLYPASDAKVIVTSECSTIGESSLRITRTHPSYATSLYARLSNLTGTNNVTASADIYSPNNSVTIALYNGATIASVRVPASSKFTPISLTGSVSSDYVDLRVQLDNVDDFVFVDNIFITY